MNILITIVYLSDLLMSKGIHDFIKYLIEYIFVCIIFTILVEFVLSIIFRDSTLFSYKYLVFSSFGYS